MTADDPAEVAAAFYAISDQLRSIRRELRELTVDPLVVARAPVDLAELVRRLEVIGANIYAAGTWIERPKDQERGE